VDLGAVVGILFAVVSYLWWYVGALLAAGAVGASLFTGVLYWFGWQDIGWLMFIVGLIGFGLFIAGAFFLNLPIYIVIVNTAFAGAFLAIAGVLLLFNQIDYPELGTGTAIAIVNESFIWILAWVVLSVVGIVAQLTAVASVVLPEERWTMATASS
jgi:hypothetical protein